MASIEDYALLGDCQGAALVSISGSIDWWCPARFDAPSVFTRLLDPGAGHWTIRPRGEHTVTRRYVQGTMVVETEFATRDGVLRLTDALALGPGERGHTVGYTSPHVLLRQLEAVRGEVTVDLEVAARPGYGLVTPLVSSTPAGVELRGGTDRLTLTGDRSFTLEDGRVTADFALRAGETAVFVLQHRTAIDRVNAPLDGRAALRDTVAAWRSWSALHQRYQGPYRDQVNRSGLVLQALTYQPTGAVVAAATTSLPEELGGGANWDYRFGWLRDGSFTLKALWVAACPDEGQRFFDWIVASVGSLGEGHVPIMLGVGGERDLTERELGHLAGYAGSRPVRVGNDAWTQKQLDVLGEVLECAWVLRDQLGELPPATATFLRMLADRAAASWRESDAGIWEGREGQRDYLTSKLMCWVALDRAVKLADRIGGQDSVQRWETAREQIRAAILDRGWNDSVKAFTGAFDSDHLDAGVLLLPIVGFLPADDERVVATVDAIERELSTDALVQRWTGAGDEGAFVICSYWLAAARALAGQVDRAKEIFEAVTGHANDVGLLSEEVDLRERRLIGNFPQALSHIGLVNAAWAIAQAEAPASAQATDQQN
jgi:GH15 family glucan-1,4-alpha-glucosidase